MIAASTANDVEEYDLVTALQSKSWLKLPHVVMADVGSAVQTLGGLLKVTNRETYVAADTIAEKANLPLCTCRKHLVTLAGKGWIKNAGRERTKRGAPRRTCTLRIPERTREALTSYAMLPWWATFQPANGLRLSWASKAVLSIVMSKMAGLITTVAELDGRADTCQDEIWGSIASLNGDDRRFLFPLRDLCEQTGLHHTSVIAAKGDLAGRKIVEWIKSKDQDGGDGEDALKPREDFKIRIRPAGEDGYLMDWIGGR